MKKRLGDILELKTETRAAGEWQRNLQKAMVTSPLRSLTSDSVSEDELLSLNTDRQLVNRDKQ